MRNPWGSIYNDPFINTTNNGVATPGTGYAGGGYGGGYYGVTPVNNSGNSGSGSSGSGSGSGGTTTPAYTVPSSAPTAPTYTPPVNNPPAPDYMSIINASNQSFQNYLNQNQTYNNDIKTMFQNLTDLFTQMPEDTKEGKFYSPNSQPIMTQFRPW